MAKTELEEAGLETEGMVESTAKLRSEILALSGVDIMENANEFKSTYKIMDELAAKWEDLTDIQQASVTELIAGKRQGNIVSSLMTNFDTARDALETSLGSEGSALKEHAKYAESLEFKLNSLKASWQAFAQTFMDSDTLKVGIDALSGLVNILEKLIDNFGLLGTIGLGVAGKGFWGYFKGAKEAKATLNDVVNAIRETSNATKEASAVSVASDEAEAVASEQAANAELREVEANTASATTELVETEANTASIAAETTEANVNVVSTTTEMAEAEANTISTTTELAEAEANIASTASEMAEATANAESTTTELAEAEANIASTATEAAEASANLTSATTEAAEGAIKAASGFKAFATSTAGIVTGIGLAVAAIALIINAYKNYKEEISQARQETIKASDEFLGAANSFEQAYIKYSGRMDLTVEEEAELEAAINGTVEALGDKSSALQSAVNSSNDYVAALEAITKAELKAADSAAKQKRDAAKAELEDTAVGLLGSTIDINLGNDSAVELAEQVASKYYKEINQYSGGMATGARKTTTFKLALPDDADANDIVEYYHTLLDYQEALSDAGLADTGDYERVSAAIGKIAESVEAYTSGAYEAAKAQYQLANGIPKTTEEYLKMREAILSSEDIKGLSLDTKNIIANGLDSEYKSVFDLSSIKAQARKLVGVINKYGDGTVDGTNDIGTMETFLNMRTAVNNNECSVGEYLAQFDEIKKMTKNYSDEEKGLLNTAFGLDTDTIKAQYDEMRKYLYRKVPAEVDERTEKEIGWFLESLTANELAAVIDIRTEIDWENTSAEDIRKYIEDQVKLNEALSFSADIEVDKTALEALNTALEESASAMGLSEESIDSLKAKYSDLEGYNPHTLFEKTANGVKVNREELAKLEKEYNDLTKTEVQEHLDTLVDEYNKCTKAIDGNIGSQEKLELIAKREKYAQQIEELAEYQAQLEGVTGAYERWLKAQETPEDYEGYEKVATSRDDIKDEISRGFLSNSTKEYIDLLSGEDLVGGSIDDYYNAWKKLDEKVGSTSYSIHDFFTVNDDGDITSTGIDRFFKGLQQDFKGSVAEFNEKSGKWEYDFSQENLQKIQDEWGLGIEAIELLLEAAAAAGYDIDWGGIFDDLDIDTSNFESVEAMISLAEKAQEEFNKLKGVEDVEFNFRTNTIEEATTEVEKARKAYLDLITNKDGSINLKAEGAEQMQFMLSTLITQKQLLSTPAIMKVDTSQIDKAKTDVIEVINKAKELQTAYENYEIAITTGVDVEGAKKDLNSAIDGMKGTSVDVRADLKLPTNEELEAAKGSIGDIKVGATLDGTSIGDMATKIQTECTPEVIAKVTGLDESAIEGDSQQVVYTAEHSDVDAFIDSLSDISKKIIYTYTTEGTKPNPSNIERSITYKYTTEGDVPEVNGTANANGTANFGRAFVRGNWGIKGSGTALVGELGMETLVRGGRFYTIGDNGAEFVKYKQGDIIFNHKQTEELFKNGKVTSDGGRGKMFANGSAYAEGTALWNATASGSKFASSRLNKKTTKKAEVKTKTRAKKDTVETTTTTTLPSANVTESNFSQENSKTSEEKLKTDKTFEETFDWIAVAIERIEREVDNLDKIVGNVYKSWGDRNAALESEIAKVGEEITLQNNAASEYLAEANAVGLDSAYISKIQNGTLNIEDFEGESDEALVEKIKEYQKWYELYLVCIDKAEELKQTESELYAQRFEHIQSQYDGTLQGFEHTESMLDEYISQAEAKGHIVSKEYYEALIDNEEANIAQLKNEQSELIKMRDAAVTDGKIAKYSEEWYDMCAEIDSVTQSIESATTATIEWSNEVRNIDWSIFDLIQERISDIATEADFLIDLMSYDKLFDDNGKLTDKGMATMGLHGQNYNTYMYAADEYGKEVTKLDAQIAQDPYDQELINRRRELIELQRESILNAEDEKQAIKDLVEEGINLELDVLQERIDLHNEELDSMKNLYDYQKNVQKQAEEIASLEKQRAAYLNDDSEESRAKLQEITLSLRDAKENLQETEYDRYISDQQKLLDSLYDEYELILNQRLDNVDMLLSQVLDAINIASGAEGVIATALGSEGAIAKALVDNGVTIKTTLENEAKEVGSTLSAAMKGIWSVDEGNAKSVITEYGKGFQDKQTTTNAVLGDIKAYINRMVDDVDKDATTKVNANKTTTSAKKNPTKTTTTTKKKNATTTNKSSGDGTPKVGDKVKFLSGKYYYDSQGVTPAGSKNHGKQVYITNINKKSWATHPYHISTGKKLGQGDLGWLKLNQISGYATGKKNFLDSEIAWTQEDGQEFIVRPSDGAILTPIAKGDSVLTSAASNNIWDMANSPAEFIKDNLNLGTANVPNSSTVQGNYTQHLDKVIFNLPNVKNYEELLSAMQKDKNFERLITSMTIDQIAGKSSLGKNKSIR